MISKLHQKREEEGFTLIELLVVIIIIGILAAIAIPTFLGQRERARRGAVQSDLRNMAINAETYFTDEQSYNDFTEGAEWDNYSASSGVVIIGHHGTSGFCIEGYYQDGAVGDAVSTANSLLPAADGDFWVYDSGASPQLYNDGDGDDCETAGYTEGSGTGGTGGTAGYIDGR